MTHAFFKALLFLAAGSVIIALHHEQDMRSMGGLRKYMPITYWTMLIGSLALIGIPGFAGFFSKDDHRGGARSRTTPGAGFAYCRVLLGVFVTALYTFRLVFMAFHGAGALPRTTSITPPHESPGSSRVPLILLAIPSLVHRLDHRSAGGVRRLLRQREPCCRRTTCSDHGEAEFHGLALFVLHAFTVAPFWLARASACSTAWYLYLKRPDLPARIASASSAALRCWSRQVRLRRALSGRLRRRRAQPRHGLLARRRRRR